MSWVWTVQSAPASVIGRIGRESEADCLSHLYYCQFSPLPVDTQGGERGLCGVVRSSIGSACGWCRVTRPGMGELELGLGLELHKENFFNLALPESCQRDYGPGVDRLRLWQCPAATLSAQCHVWFLDHIWTPALQVHLI
jgi:hypothetical protein